MGITPISHRAHRAFQLQNAAGVRVVVCSHGASIASVHVPDGTDITRSTARHEHYLGVTVGPVAGRIAEARFVLDGKRYDLDANDGPHHLHSGAGGWHRRTWDGQPIETPGGPGIQFTLVDAGGPYPGVVRATVSYCLTDDAELAIVMRAVPDAPTPLNMTNHVGWNLGGATTIDDHLLTIQASRFTPAADGGAGGLPDGTISDVGGHLDFRTPSPLAGREVDHNFLVDGPAGTIRPVARLEHPDTGRRLEVASDRSSVQVWTADSLQSAPRSVVCLETQEPPNAINVAAWAPAVIFRPGERYEHRLVYTFA